MAKSEHERIEDLEERLPELESTINRLQSTINRLLERPFGAALSTGIPYIAPALVPSSWLSPVWLAPNPKPVAGANQADMYHCVWTLIHATPNADVWIHATDSDDGYIEIEIDGGTTTRLPDGQSIRASGTIRAHGKRMDGNANKLGGVLQWWPA